MLLNIASKGATALQTCSPRILLDVTRSRAAVRASSAPHFPCAPLVARSRSRVSVSKDRYDQKRFFRRYASNLRDNEKKEEISAEAPALPSLSKSKFQNWNSRTKFPSACRSRFHQKVNALAKVVGKTSKVCIEHDKILNRESLSTSLGRSSSSPEGKNEKSSTSENKSLRKTRRKWKSRFEPLIGGNISTVNANSQYTPDTIEAHSTAKVLKPHSKSQEKIKDVEKDHFCRSFDDSYGHDVGGGSVERDDKTSEKPKQESIATSFRSPSYENNNIESTILNDEPVSDRLCLSADYGRFLRKYVPNLQPTNINGQKQSLRAISNTSSSILMERLKDKKRKIKNVIKIPKEDSRTQISSSEMRGAVFNKEGSRKERVVTTSSKKRSQTEINADFGPSSARSRTRKYTTDNTKDSTEQFNKKTQFPGSRAATSSSDDQECEVAFKRYRRVPKATPPRAQYLFEVRFGHYACRDVKKPHRHINDYDDYHPSGLSQGLVPFIFPASKKMGMEHRRENVSVEYRPYASGPAFKSLLTNKLPSKHSKTSISGISVDSFHTESASFNAYCGLFGSKDDSVGDTINTRSGCADSVREVSGLRSASGSSGANASGTNAGSVGVSVGASGSGHNSGNGSRADGNKGDLKKPNVPSGGSNKQDIDARATAKADTNITKSSDTSHAEPFLSGTGARYIEEMHEVWRKSPESVHASWNSFFRQLEEGVPVGNAYSPPPGVRPASGPVEVPGKQNVVSADQKSIMQQLALQNIADYYQMYGHFQAEIDPLEFRGPAIGTQFVKANDKKPPEIVKNLLDANQMTDMKKNYLVPLNTSIANPGEKELPLEEILNRLQNTYCRYIGIEYMHIPSMEKRQWIREQFEPGIKYLTASEKQKVWKRLIHTSAFEDFLSRKWPTLFRFSVEGCEILVPALQQILDKYVAVGTDHFVFGMAHRGRLNVIANILNKDIDKLLLHFKKDVNFDKHLGDVKYHLGCYVTQKHEESNKDIAICIVSNASHLESVNPMVQGRCKAEQIILNDHKGQKVVPIIVHGDAAYAGQGVVYEQNTMCSIPNYDVHGILHLVINNNIGFTTPPEESRSTPYCTDVAKLVHSPVFHVNCEKPDEVMHCINVACAYRNRFHSDVVIDLVCYRRYGHNEADEPAYTSPVLYSKIRARKSFTNEYTEQLLKEKVITQDLVEKEKEAYFKKCEEGYKASEKHTTIDWRDWNDSPWKDFSKESVKELQPTGVSETVLKDIAYKSITVPDGFVIHKLLQRVFQNRKKMIDTRTIDWTLAESLAFGTLLKEGVLVRLSGQDAQRGTFSHRHHVLHHQQKNEEKYVPLNHLSDKQGKYFVVNTPLIEYGSLAFEIGFAMSFANALVVFEAQYGDFLNNAQIIIDAYLSSAESKWGRQCGLVMLLPHGLEGLGSEHSSARLERYLQLSGEPPDLVSDINNPEFSFNQLKNTNWIIASCTTPANFFHILRRQIALPFRKPLVLMSPKSLLRHPECKSSLDQLIENTTFQSVIPDMGPASSAPDTVKKHILCTGKVFYDLKEKRKTHNLDSTIAITRIEQLCPFPFDYVLKEIKKYPQSEICWVQEEHKNQGPWNFVLERLSSLLSNTDWYAISYVGRAVSPVPAVATPFKHNQEKEEFLEAAMITKEDTAHRGIKSYKFCPTDDIKGH